ncbi:MAG: response regulator [Anaerolineae bacterium]|nr:response regulator [Anaerolineae bacterium]
MAHKKRVLVVDDEISVRKICQFILQMMGFEVETAADGMEAVEKAREKPFDLIITDIKMPGINGVETARLIREIYPDVPWIVMTAYGQLDLALKAIRLGVNGFLLKPFTPDELKALVSYVMEMDQLRRESLRIKALLPLFDISKTLLSTLNLEELENKLLLTAWKSLSADGVWMYEVDWDKLLGKPVESLPRLTLELQAKLMKALENSSSAILWTQENPQEVASLMEKAGLAQLLAAPLKAGERLLGFLAVFKNPGSAPFLMSDHDFLTILAGQGAIALENIKLFEQIQKAFVELQEVERLKSNFVTIIAHEFRTPLSLILGYASILREEIQDPRLKEFAEAITRNALRLSSLLKDLLDFRQLEKKAVSLQVESVFLPELVGKVLESYEPLANDKKLEIAIDIPPEVHRVQADPAKLEVVLSNLISNAIKFTPPGGKITIGARLGDRPYMFVKDTGIGIPPEEKEKIFLSFYQIGEPLNRGQKGFGLGLYITKELVNMWGGRIWVESEVGKGSTFWFTLPSTRKEENVG